MLQCNGIMRIVKLSGETLCSFDEKALEDLSDTYGPHVKGLKRHCKPLIDASIYRQRLLLNNEELDNDQSLQQLTQGAPELHLVLVPFQENDLKETLDDLQDAAKQGLSDKVEQILKIPIHPDPPPHLVEYERAKRLKCALDYLDDTPIYTDIYIYIIVEVPCSLVFMLVIVRLLPRF